MHLMAVILLNRKGKLLSNFNITRTSPLDCYRDVVGGHMRLWQPGTVAKTDVLK